jgi:acyl carrier protein
MFEKVREIIADKLNISQDDIKRETSFADDLGVDSMELFDVIVGIEEEYNVEIPSEVLDGLHTVEDVINYVSSTLAA